MNGKIEVIDYREDGSKLYDQEFVNDKMDGMVEFREDGQKSEVRRVNYKSRHGGLVLRGWIRDKRSRV